MFKKILIVFAFVLAVFIGVVSLQPSDFQISRSTTIAAAPTEVFSQVNDFHLWENWSPWAKLDPSMKTTFDGPAFGEGSAYSWAGNKQVGEGKMTLLESQASERILIQLDFLKPMQATNMTEFTFKPEGEGTTVTWTMSGKNNFVAKIFCLFMSMEKMVGPDFEKGLSQLKAVVEAARKQ